MRAASPWTPRLADGPGSPYERLVAALAEDIIDRRGASGLPPGTRLPSHRALAQALGVSVGTVTKAYAALERRGLVRGERGRATFVTYQAPDAVRSIDLADNAPPRMLGDHALAAALAAVGRRVDASGLAAYGPPGGLLEHRRAVASWIALSGLDLPPDELILCNGAQHGIAAALLAASPNGVRAEVYTEAVTFPGFLRYASLSGHRVHGVAFDEEGLHPAALDQALSRRRPSAAQALIYVTPILHNPTTATMGRRRRRDIVRIARTHDAVIVEDDVYALSRDRDALPLSSLAPERTFYVTSASKALSPAVRVGAVRPPRAAWERTVAAVRALAQPVSPLQCELLAELTRAGVAREVATAIRREGARRSTLAREMIGPALVTADTGYHAFLPLPRTVADAVVLAATTRGVELTEPASMMADPNSPRSGIRLCL
ncbi:MAG: PLP-dependent aminotransferase family protein, partial [Micromonosporaceae bacterium]|nr:PLP-dependent aminotransferase family protein [Micromonosporaceae bacterium]